MTVKFVEVMAIQYWLTLTLSNSIVIEGQCFLSINSTHPLLLQISGFLLHITLNLSCSIIIEVQTLLSDINIAVYLLLKFKFINYVQHHG